jgi:hypothetical protein
MPTSTPIPSAPSEPPRQAARAGGNREWRRRWLVAVDPIFEGGRWGQRARAWNVENELIAIAILGDVTIDLSRTSSAPREVEIDAYTFIRDVDVLVADGTHVETDGSGLLGRSFFGGDVRNDVPAVPEDLRDRVIRVHGHTMFGDVHVRLAKGHQREEPSDLPGLWAKLTGRWNTVISNRRIGLQRRPSTPHTTKGNCDD